MDSLLTMNFVTHHTASQDLRECWEEFAIYADLSVTATPSGEACMKVTAHLQEKDWTLQHSKCAGEKSIVYKGSDGCHVCKKCFDLGNDQKFLTRISSFLQDMDSARLLWSRCFATETVEQRIDELREKVVYKRRSKTAYEKMFAKPVEQLHKEARRKEEEKQLLLEAGAELSCIGANPKALEFFGLKWMQHNQHNGTLAKLHAWGLPNMVSPDAEALQRSDHLISIKFKRPEASGHRRLICAMDRTYLETSMQLLQTEKGSGFRAHRPQGFLEKDESLRPLNREEGTKTWNTRDVKRASEMESFLVWDGKRESSYIYELAAYPCLPGASKDDRLELGVDEPKNMRGKWEFLHRCGFVLENAPSLKWILCDGHGSHAWLHQLLLGQSIDLPDTLLQHVPFFRSLTRQDLPLVCFPLPWRNVLIDGSTIHYLPGLWLSSVAHLQKNLGEQMRSVIRTLHFGKHWADSSPALETGLWPASFVGADGMSDRQAALLPLVLMAKAGAPKFAIPYCLQGSFLFSLIGAHAVAPILHKTGDRAWRLEVAMTGSWIALVRLCLLNLGVMMASATGKQLGLPTRAVWLDTRTHRGLKDLCGAAICGLWGCQESISWPSLTERRLEQRFGRVRTCMPNNCLTASDYWRCSASIMRRDDRKACEKLDPPVDDEQLLTHNSFCTIAQKAFQAALKLASLCSGVPTTELAAEFHSTNSGATCEAEMEPDDDNSDNEGLG
eukprot:s3656_g3.t1